jgi:hypothetical protein
MRFRPHALAPLGVVLLALPCFAADAPTELPKALRERRLEGGVTFAFSTETWSRSMYGYGPRFDVGLGVGNQLAVVVGESARFSFGSSESLRMMSFGVQTGVAYGAPYQTRTGFGAAILVGAERLSTSTTEEALVAWGVTGSVGVRGSVTVGPVDVWVGFDGVARSETIRVGRPDPYGVGALSMLISMGCFFPALTGPMITVSR